MRKFLIVFLALTFLVAGSVLAYDEGSEINIKEASGGSGSDPVRVYTLVRNPEQGDDVAALSSGNLVLWDCSSDDGVTINIATAESQSVDAVAGVTVGSIETSDYVDGTAETDFGKRNWGYIQIYGPTDDLMLDVQAGAAVSGQALTASAIPGKCEVPVLDTGTNTAESIGFAFDTEATTADIEAFIRLR